MKISPITNFIPSVNMCSNNSRKNFKSFAAANSCNFVNSEAIKAKFCPSFGNFRTVEYTYLEDKNTGKQVKASIQKDRFGTDYIEYKLMVGREEGGIIGIDLRPKPSFEDIYLKYDNEIPYVTRLRSFLGNKYKGIGTKLIQKAIEESEKAGKLGQLCAYAEKGYMADFSEHRSNESPIPFYYKLGFIAEDKGADRQIKECIKNNDYESLPNNEFIIYLNEKR